MMRYLAIASTLLGASSLLAAADPQLLSLLMPDAQIVAGVNVAKAKTSPFGQFVLRQMPANADFDKFVNMSGFDPRRDLTEVLVASVAGHKNGLVAARGTFDSAKIVALAAADGKHAVSTYNGAKVVTGTDPDSKEAFAFLDTNFAVMGDLANVKAAIDRRTAATPISSQLAAKIAMYGAADAWTVSLVPLSNLGAPKGATGGPLDGLLQGDLLKKVKESSGGVTFDSPVKLTGELIADTDKDATALGDVVKLLASLVQTNEGAGAPVATLVKSLTVGTEGNVLTLGLSIPEAQLESLIESAKSQGKKKAAVRI